MPGRVFDRILPSYDDQYPVALSADSRHLLLGEATLSSRWELGGEQGDRRLTMNIVNSVLRLFQLATSPRPELTYGSDAQFQGKTFDMALRIRIIFFAFAGCLRFSSTSYLRGFRPSAVISIFHSYFELLEHVFLTFLRRPLRIEKRRSFFRCFRPRVYTNFQFVFWSSK